VVLLESQFAQKGSMTTANRDIDRGIAENIREKPDKARLG
jgi:hypothetical protein